MDTPFHTFDRTDQALEAPRPGDLFVESYAYWMAVLDVTAEEVIFIDTETAPGGVLPRDGVIHRLPLSEFRARYRPEALSVRLAGRGHDFSAWYAPEREVPPEVLPLLEGARAAVTKRRRDAEEQERLDAEAKRVRVEESWRDVTDKIKAGLTAPLGDYLVLHTRFPRANSEDVQYDLMIPGLAPVRLDFVYQKDTDAWKCDHIYVPGIEPYSHEEPYWHWSRGSGFTLLSEALVEAERAQARLKVETLAWRERQRRREEARAAGDGMKTASEKLLEALREFWAQAGEEAA